MAMTAGLRVPQIGADVLSMSEELAALGGGSARVDSVRVFCRLRPQHGSQAAAEACNDGVVLHDPRRAEGVPSEKATRRYKVNGCLSPSASQTQAWECVCGPALEDVLQGFNASIVVYGQVGCGKSYSVWGDCSGHGDSEGFVERSLHYLLGSATQGRCLSVCAWEVLPGPSSTMDLIAKAAGGDGSRSGKSRVLVRSAEDIERVLQCVRGSCSSCHNGIPVANAAHTFVSVQLTENAGSLVGPTLTFADLAGATPLWSSRQSVKHFKPGPDLDLHRRELSQQLLCFARLIGDVATAQSGNGGSRTVFTGRDSALTAEIAPLLNCSGSFSLLGVLSSDPEDHLDTLNTLRVGTRAQSIKLPLLQQSYGEAPGNVVSPASLMPNMKSVASPPVSVAPRHTPTRKTPALHSPASSRAMHRSAPPSVSPAANPSVTGVSPVSNIDTSRPSYASRGLGSQSAVDTSLSAPHDGEPREIPFQGESMQSAGGHTFAMTEVGEAVELLDSDFEEFEDDALDEASVKEETANAWLASESPEAALSQSVYNVQPSVHPTVDASSPLRDGVPLRDQFREVLASMGDPTAVADTSSVFETNVKLESTMNNSQVLSSSVHQSPAPAERGPIAGTDTGRAVGYDSLLAHLQKAEAMTAEQATRIAELENSLAESKMAAAVQSDDHQFRVRQLQLRVRELESGSRFADVFNAYERDIAAAQEDARAARDELSQLLQTLPAAGESVLTSGAAHVQSGTALLRRHLKSAERESKRMRAELAEIRKRERLFESQKRFLADLTKKHEAARKEVESKNFELELRDKALEEAASNISELQTELGKAQAREADLMQQSAPLLAEVESLRLKLSDQTKNRRREALLTKFSASPARGARSRGSAMSCLRRLERELGSVAPALLPVVRKVYVEVERYEEERLQSEAQQREMVTTLLHLQESKGKN